jgi:hypothetical protein
MQVGVLTNYGPDLPRCGDQEVDLRIVLTHIEGARPGVDNICFG